MKFALRRQSTGWFYPYLAVSAHLMMRAFMRKIYVVNRKRLPTDQPVLLAANHPTAFLDPCVLGTFMDAPLYNMTRGDIFEKPFFRRLMESVNMFPVYRLRDGYGNRDRNDEVFEFCRQKLEQRRVVTIYVEGEHHLEYRVKPIRKGIARIAFGTFERHQLHDLQIIPAGCNYLYGDRPRDEVMACIGTPIWVRDYWTDYQNNPARAIQRLLGDIEKALKTVCLHIENPEDDVLAGQLLTLARSDLGISLIPIVEYTDRRFLAEKAVCDRINALAQPEKTALAGQANAYFGALQANGLNDGALVHPEWGAWFKLPLFVLAFLPFLLGFLSSWPVIALAKFATRRLARKREFVSSIHLGVGHFGGILYYSIWLVAALCSANPWWIALSLSLPILGWYSMHYRELWARWTGARRAAGHPERARLLALRQVLQHDEARIEGIQAGL